MSWERKYFEQKMATDAAEASAATWKRIAFTPPPAPQSLPQPRHSLSYTQRQPNQHTAGDRKRQVQVG